MYSLYIDLYIYKNSHCTKETHAYRHKQQRERQIPQRGKCTLERFLFFFFLQLISIYMCAPKTRLSGKRCIHPKFIFVRADFFFFLMKGEWGLEDTHERLICPAIHLERRLARRAEQREQQGQARPQPASGFLDIPGLWATGGAGLGGGGPRLDEHPDPKAPLRTPARLAEVLPPTPQNKSPRPTLSGGRGAGRGGAGGWAAGWVSVWGPPGCGGGPCPTASRGCH